jgi:hypothetical protein
MAGTLVSQCVLDGWNPGSHGGTGGGVCLWLEHFLVSQCNTNRFHIVYDGIWLEHRVSQFV